SVIAERDRVIQAQEEASNRLQRDLHDGPTQLVAAMQMSIEFCKTALEKDITKVGPELDNMQVLSEKATHQMRTMLFELRPLELETKGLVAALETFVERRQKSEDTDLVLNVRSDKSHNAFPRLKSKYERALFAITQEAVNNALKYAKADHIYINLYSAGNRSKLAIVDDGLGFDLHSVTSNYENRGSYGMINQRERAELLGTELIMKSAPGAGTEITADFLITPEMQRE
ncbi:MAG: sensor histidine kinase, partial [Chloroflexota bacterium]